MMTIDKNKQFPVECLNESIIDVINNTNDFISSIKDECMYNGLSPLISYKRDNHNFNDSGEIKTIGDKNYIFIGVGYCQYLWSVGLYLTFYFDNYVQPRNMNRILNVNNTEKEFVISSFTYSFNMIHSNTYSVDTFWKKPNILEDDLCKDIIGQANGLYCGAIAFIIAHEFSHHFLGHLDCLDNNSFEKEEFDSDSNAISLLLKNKSWKENFRVGICSVFASILLIDKESVKGGDCHPDLDCRIKKVMEQLDLDESDIIWGYMGCAIHLWLQKYTTKTKEDDETIQLNTYKDMFYYYLGKLTESKNDVK